MSGLTGSRIGRIRVDALLGAGGMGEVYRGWDERLERPVAIKVIQPAKSIHEGIRSRFIREARLLSRLEHPNICRIYDVIEDESGSYLVLELIEGRTLRAVIEGGIDAGEAVRIAGSVARVLAFAHERGIVHRDLKPDNIMLTTSGEVKVLDFGLARLVQPDDEPPSFVPAGSDVDATAIIDLENTTARPSFDLTRTSAGTLVGTLHYMSPEQARGAPLSAASDVYSLGVVLYELLSRGISPYGDTASTADLLAKVRKAEIDLAPLHDRDCARLISRMTSVEPAQRPGAAEAARELARIAGRPERRRRNAIIAAGIAAIALLAIGTIYFAQRSIARPLFTHGGGKIAVLPFRNDTHQRGNEWIELGLMDMVMQGLGAVHDVQLVPADDVLKALKNAGVARGAELTPSARARLLDNLGADTLLAATVASNGSQYAIRYRFLLRDREESPRQVEAPAVTDAANEMAARLTHRLDPKAQKVDIRDRYSFDEFANVAYAIGTQELLTNGPRAAAHYFTVCLDRDGEFAWAKLQLARCHIMTGEVSDVAALLDDADRTARRKGDRKLVASVLATQAANLTDRGDYPGAERAARAALEAANAAHDLLLVGRAQRAIGVVTWRTNRLDEAQRWMNESCRSFVAVRSAADEASSYAGLGAIDDLRYDGVAARAHLERALQLAVRANDTVQVARITGNLGNSALTARDAAAAERYCRQALALASRTGERMTQLTALINLGIALYMQNRETEAIAATEQARAIGAELHVPMAEANALINIAFAYTVLGRLDLAERDLDAADGIRAKLGSPRIDQLAGTIRAYWLIRNGSLDAAQRKLDEADRITLTKNSWVMRARLLYERRDYKGAAEAIHRARDMNEMWLPSDQRMFDAIDDAARTGRPSSIPFEHPLRR